MIKSLTIGKKQFDTNLIQAPLAGVSCAPFRELVWQFGGIAYCCTEMLSALHIASNADRSPRYQFRAPNEKNLCWQLSTNKPDILARASAYAISKGADILDLNCGCPQPKIRKKGCGSKLLLDEKNLIQLVKAMKQDAAVPVTVKMRIDANHNDYCDIAIAKILENAGADAIIVHGRHWTHDYDVAADMEAIANVVSAVSIPVIANGDITDTHELKNVFEKTHCAGFMIGRASVGQPWIYQKITNEMLGEKFISPSLNAIGQLFLQHAEKLIALEAEKPAIFQCRKLGKYYARTMENKTEFIAELNHIDVLSELKHLIGKYFITKE